MKLKKRFNKIVSWVLCLAMVFNLMPVFPALGAAPSADDYSGHKGFILGYDTTTVAEKKVAVVTVYAHNIDQYAASFSWRFQYDTDKLDLVLGKEITGRNPVPAGVKADLTQTAQMDMAVITGVVPEDSPAIGYGVPVGTPIAGVAASPFEAFSKNGTKEHGKLILDMNCAQTVSSSYWDKNPDADTEVKLDQDVLYPLFSMYFAGKATDSSDPASVTDIPADLDQSAFGLYNDNYLHNSSWAVLDSNNQLLNGSLNDPIWVNFPEPEAAKYPVSIKITQLSETGAALNGATVEIDGPNFPKELI